MKAKSNILKTPLLHIIIIAAIVTAIRGLGAGLGVALGAFIVYGGGYLYLKNKKKGRTS